MPSIEIRRPADLGAVIKAARTAKGLRQEDVAESLGFSRLYLVDLEAGKTNIYAVRLFRVLRKLGVRVTVTYELPKREDDRNA